MPAWDNLHASRAPEVTLLLRPGEARASRAVDDTLEARPSRKRRRPWPFVVHHPAAAKVRRVDAGCPRRSDARASAGAQGSNEACYPRIAGALAGSRSKRTTDPESRAATSALRGSRRRGDGGMTVERSPPVVSIPIRSPQHQAHSSPGSRERMFAWPVAFA